MDKGFAVLEIDQEFKNLIRPLRKDEYLQLEVNLTIDGCRDPIITWNNIIIDGHNRYEICNRLRIPYAVREMPFESRDQVIVWICNNQLGRRNISEETRRYLIGKQYELEKVVRKNPPNINGFNQYKQRSRKDRGGELQAHGTEVQCSISCFYRCNTKYAIFSKALDTVDEPTQSFPVKFFLGRSRYPMKTLSRFQRCRRKKSGGSVADRKTYSAHLPATAIPGKSF